VMSEALAGVVISTPRLPIVVNVRAEAVTEEEKIRALLVAQVTSPVRWVESVKALVAAGVTRVVEVGPGKVLTGLVKQIDKGLEVSALDEPEALAKLLLG